MFNKETIAKQNQEVMKHYRTHLESIMNKTTDEDKKLLCRRMIDSDEFMMSYLALTLQLYYECEDFAASLQLGVSMKSLIDLLIKKDSKDE